MRAFSRRLRASVSIGASLAALAATATPALAQEEAGNPEPLSAQEAADADGNQIIVTGIRASLQQALNIKRNAVGVVDAISAEDIGKFPDTNLAESLQRITGVSIDRSMGEGSTVTVRGFGPEFNLVLLNGRQMPTSGLGGCCEAPSSRSFDFANLASEGVAGVQVYKSNRVGLPTGGIGSTINILTPRPLDRPGFQGSIAAKGVLDNTFDDTKITPEVSGILSKTFADETVGILVTGSYQQRKASFGQFSVGEWRQGYLGNENNWGSLAQPGTPGAANIENRPEATDIYQVPQNAAYDFTDIKRERINGQAVLQFRPADSLTARIDYTFSQNTVDGRTNSIGVWFNHGDTSSSWTDGPVAGANFYAERFPNGVGINDPLDAGKDLAITGAVSANRSINRSLGGNLVWDPDGSGFRFELDAHHSTAESKPTSPYGSNIAVGASIFGVQSQRVDFTTAIPTISVAMYPGREINAANIRPSGNAFRNAYMRDRIDEISLRGGYDFDASFIDSLDFGVTYTDNAVRSAYGFIQNDTWGGTLRTDQTPDNLFTPRDLAPDLKGFGELGSGIIPTYFRIDTEGLIALLDSARGICAATAGGPGTCLAPYTIDRKINERTLAPYVQSLHTFDLFSNPSHLRLGLRYEVTDVKSDAVVPQPLGTTWVAANEIAIRYQPGLTQVTSLKGSYDNWLPAIDFDAQPIEGVMLRASYSHTLTRPGYASLQGGLTLASPIRPALDTSAAQSTAQQGNAGLLPYKSKNFDASVEWYFAPSSYASAGFFYKTVSNFPVDGVSQGPQLGVTDPARGAAAQAARAALGANATYAQILTYIAAINPALVTRDGSGNPNGILSTPNDPLVNFVLTQPYNSDRVAKLHGFEFAVQHSFWDTGFGAILNYTIVNSDSQYNNTLQYLTPQFAVTGVSDSANAVVYYDKNGIQARVAYNWRDEFLSGYGQDPFYVEAYGQFDASASWEVTKGFTVFAEGINITGADRRGHRRADQAVYFAAPGYARYAAGVRYSF